MAEEIRILVDDSEHATRGLLFLTVDQGDDGAASLGLFDPEFTVPGLTSTVDVDGESHVTSIDFAHRDQRELSGPHFTFHPPTRMHLRVNGRDYLAAQLVMMDLQLLQDGRIPWLTIVSKRVNLLPFIGEPAKARQLLVKCSPESSIAINVDLIASMDHRAGRRGDLLDEVVRWPARTLQSMVPEWFLHLTADQVAARPVATFTWHQQT